MNAFSNLAFGPNILYLTPTLLFFPLVLEGVVTLLQPCCVHLSGQQTLQFPSCPSPWHKPIGPSDNPHRVSKTLACQLSLTSDDQLAFISTLGD